MNKNSEIMCHLLIKIELPLAPLASELRFVVIRANSWAINDSSVGGQENCIPK